MPQFPDGAPCWADLGSDDIPTLGEFLSRVLGWTTEAPPGMGGYTICSGPHGPVLGIGPRSTGGGEAHVSVSLATGDVDAAAARATEAGAHLDAGPVSVPGTGRFAVVSLPADQHVVLWQTLGQDGFAALGETGCPCWFELVTPEVEATEEVLAATLGTEFADGPDGARVARVDGVPRYMLFPAGGDLTPGWAVHVRVDDLDAVTARCAELGGTVVPGQAGTEGGMRYQGMRTPDGAPIWAAQPA